MKQYVYLVIALLFAALNFNLILKSNNFVTGGTQGVALLLQEMTPLSAPILIFVINMTMLIISYVTLPKKTTYGTAAASFIYPVIVKITTNIGTYLPKIQNFLQQYDLIAAIVAGCVFGMTSGCIYRLGFSAGGIASLHLIVEKYCKIKVAWSNFLINTAIIITGCFFFGISKGIYSILIIAIGSLLIRCIMNN